jgi:hypothetical protein
MKYEFIMSYLKVPGQNNCFCALLGQLREARAKSSRTDCSFFKLAEGLSSTLYVLATFFGFVLIFVCLIYHLNLEIDDRLDRLSVSLMGLSNRLGNRQYDLFHRL